MVGQVSTIAGKNEIYFGEDTIDGPTAEATFGRLKGIAVDRHNTIYFCEPSTNKIRKISEGTSRL
jgi:hypothetical protein